MVRVPCDMCFVLCRSPKVFADGKPPAQGELSGVLKELGFDETNVFKF